MSSKIIIAADQKAKRLSYQESLEKLRPTSEFTLVKSYKEIIDSIEKENISLIVLDQEVCDAGRHRNRREAINELKDISKNIPIIVIGTERGHAIESIIDGADGFIPMHWLSAD